MMDPDDVAAAVAGVRELVAADGGDLRVVEIGADSVRLALRLDTAECADCVMPRPFLETVALDMMRPMLSALASVAIDDPREKE